MASTTDFDRDLADVVKDNFQKKNAARQATRNLRTGISRSINARGVHTGKFSASTRGSFRGSYNSRPAPYHIGIRPRHLANDSYVSMVPMRGSFRGRGRPAQRFTDMQPTFRDQAQPHQYIENGYTHPAAGQGQVPHQGVALPRGPPRVAADDGGLTRVLVSNLEHGVTLEDIKELYQEFGRTTRMVLNFDKAGRSLGTAEIVYERRGDALKAMQTYNGIPLDGKSMCVEVVSNEPPQRTPVVGSNRLGVRVRKENNYRPNGDYSISYAHSLKTRPGPTDYDNPIHHRGANPFFRPSLNINHNLKRAPKPTKTPRESNPSKTAEELDKELDKYLMSKKD